MSEIVRLDHVADFYRRYRGEPVTLFTRVTAHADLEGYTLRISLPSTVDPTQFVPPADVEIEPPRVRVYGDEQTVLWRCAAVIPRGTQHEYRLHFNIPPRDEAWTLLSTAEVVVVQAEQRHRVQETVSIAISAKSRYLKYLPALYEADDFMGRFLMLFESFWGPLENQIDNLWYYFDPLLTPAPLLPWLASWFNLKLDERWPEEARRRLIKSAIRLYRMRGHRGLVEYLKAITGVEPQITEHFASNFVLGAGARLGPNFALGRGNVPHTITVTLALPPLPSSGDPEVDRRRAYRRRRMIEQIIEAEKPAHVAYTLRIVEADEPERDSSPSKHTFAKES